MGHHRPLESQNQAKQTFAQKWLRKHNKKRDPGTIDDKAAREPLTTVSITGFRRDSNDGEGEDQIVVCL